MAVAIYIRHRNGKGRRTAGVIADRWHKRAVAVAQQHTYNTVLVAISTGTFVSHDQVRMAVAIHIRHPNRTRARSPGVVADCRLEGTVAVSQQHAYDAIRAPAAAITVHAVVCYQQIGMAVVIEIRDRNPKGSLTTCVVTDWN